MTVVGRGCLEIKCPFKYTTDSIKQALDAQDKEKRRKKERKRKKKRDKREEIKTSAWSQLQMDFT